MRRKKARHPLSPAARAEHNRRRRVEYRRRNHKKQMDAWWDLQDEIAVQFPRLAPLTRRRRNRHRLTSSELAQRMAAYDMALSPGLARRWLRAFIWAAGTALFDGDIITLPGLCSLRFGTDGWKAPNGKILATIKIRAQFLQRARALLWGYYRKRGEARVHVEWTSLLNPQRIIARGHGKRTKGVGGRSADVTVDAGAPASSAR